MANEFDAWDARFKGIPVVMHSSLSSDANRAMGRSVGVDADVPKFDPAMLADTRRPLLDARAAWHGEVKSTDSNRTTQERRVNHE